MRLVDLDADKKYLLNGRYAIGVIEPNLVLNPDEIERGDVIEIGKNIVVMHHDDYYDMFLKSAAVDDGSWERFVAEPCDDAISREDAIEQIVNTPTLNQNKGQEYLEGSATRQNEIIDILKSLPSVAPSRPSGEWIPKDGGFYCSCCNNGSAGLSEDDVYVYEIPLPNYCKDCGAHMKGADDESLLQ